MNFWEIIPFYGPTIQVIVKSDPGHLRIPPSEAAPPEAMACEQLSQRLAGRKQDQIESIIIEEAATTALEAAQERTAVAAEKLVGGNTKPQKPRLNP